MLLEKLINGREIEAPLFFGKSISGDIDNVEEIAQNAMDFNKGSICRTDEETGLISLDFAPDSKYLSEEIPIGSFQWRYKLATARLANGFGFSFRVHDWRCINYVALGYSLNGQFRHVKLLNPCQGTWIDFSICHSDLAWELHNVKSDCEAQEISDLRIYIKGAPAHAHLADLLYKERCHLEIRAFGIWLENRIPPPWLLEWQSFSRSDAVVEAVYAYLGEAFHHYEEQAQSLMLFGDCPLYNEISLPWNSAELRPSDLPTVNTYRFAWHALHPAIIALLHSHRSGGLAPLFLAREFFTNWLDSSYYSPDMDRKYCWYDHGTAERLLAMLLLWIAGLEQCFDRRFMLRLRMAIFRHSQLLASEVFYASHQPTRYHNHAWFQDCALMAAAGVMEDLPCAARWQEIAAERLTDQIEKLIIRDGGYAVFVENSIGYHQGVGRLLRFAGALTDLKTGGTSLFSEVAVELNQFSHLLTYPDGRVPAQGDTFRRENPTLHPNLDEGGGAWSSEFVALPTAGYMVAKGGGNSKSWMLAMFGTNLSRTHKHQDDLSFTLFLDGVEWFIDPSYLSHEYAQAVPAYLRSPAAHNMVSLPGLEYSIEPSDGRVKLEAKPEPEDWKITGSHDSYLGYRVQRELRIKHIGQIPEIRGVDRFRRLYPEGGGEAGIDEGLLVFHLGDGVRVERLDASDGRGVARFILSHSASRCSLALEIAFAPPEGATLPDALMDRIKIDNSISGLGFMREISTCSIHVPMFKDVNCCWSIYAN